jgi:hypothetical protein
MQVRLRKMTESRIFGGLVMFAIALSSAALAMARPSMGEVEFVRLPALPPASLILSSISFPCFMLLLFFSQPLPFPCFFDLIRLPIHVFRV